MVIALRLEMRFMAMGILLPKDASAIEFFKQKAQCNEYSIKYHDQTIFQQVHRKKKRAQRNGLVSTV